MTVGRGYEGGGCAGLRAALGAIPATSAGMTDLSRAGMTDLILYGVTELGCGGDGALGREVVGLFGVRVAELGLREVSVGGAVVVDDFAG